MISIDKAEGEDKTFIFFRDQLTEPNMAMAEILNSNLKNDDESKQSILIALNYILESHQRAELIECARKFRGSR